MAQLLVKKSSWWEFNAKQAMIWVPVAAVQASTLAGLGYFYHRLNELEAQPPRQPVLANTLQDVKAPGSSRTSRIPPPPPPPPPSAPAPTAVQVVLDSTAVMGVMQVGQDFSRTPLAPQKSQSMADKKQPVWQERVSARLAAKPVVLAAPTARVGRMSAVDADAARTADANRTRLRSTKTTKAVSSSVPEPSREMDVGSVGEVVSAVQAAVAPSSGKPLPVGTVAWVYLGELRDYGWHGQRLHVAPDSGLPLVGNSYHTQELHGIYSEPHGKRVMGGFQQGDLVTILDVRHEPNNGVWARVRKAQAVGRLNR